MLETEQLSVQFGGHLAVDQVSCRFNAGTLTAIVGPNGAGKSTLLKVISRAIGSQGQLRFEGQSLHDYSTEQVVGLGICHCPEGRRLFPELTVVKNLQLGLF